MSGHRGHLHSKPAREIFLTSSSLSFSSLSSCSSSWNDALELSTKDSRTSCEYKNPQKGKISNAPTQGSEISGLTPRVRMQPVPSPPSRLPPVPLMNKGLGYYDPDRIPASVFNKTGEGNWSEMSNDSLFSLKVDGQRMSSAFRISNIRPEEVMMPGEYLSYSPSLLGMLEDVEEDKRSEVKEIKSAARSAETDRHQEKSSSSTPAVSCSSSTDPNNSFSVDQAWSTKVQPVSLPVREKKGKKTRKSKKKKNKKKDKKKKNKCCIWSWLYSRFSKCRYNLCCYEWRKYCCCCCCCCCRPEATGS